MERVNQMKKFNIMCAKPYKTKSGEDKTKWVRLGSCVQTDDGKMFGDIDAIPTGAWFEVSIQFFEQEQQNQQGGQQNQQQGYGQQQQQGGYGQQQQYQGQH